MSTRNAIGHALLRLGRWIAKSDPPTIDDEAVAEAQLLERNILERELHLIDDQYKLNAQRATCEFRSPDKVIVNLLRASTQTTSQVKSCVLDAMASCGVYRDYAVRKKKFDTAVDVRDAPRPQLPGYGSMKWGLIRNWLANY